MVDRYNILWCYGVCGCTGSPFLKQLKVLLGSDETLEEEGPQVDPSSTVLSRQVDPSPTKRSGATVNLSSPSRSLFPLSRSLFLSQSLPLPISRSLSFPPFSLPQFLKFLRSGLGICFVFPVDWGMMLLPFVFFLVINVFLFFSFFIKRS